VSESTTVVERRGLAPLRAENRFEQRARAAKVAAILSLVPLRLAKGGAQLHRMADRLALFTPDERRRFGARAGLKRPPSATTWAAAVAAVRERAGR
jgi:hypothetical protein